MAASKKTPAPKPIDDRPRLAEVWRRLDAHVAAIGAPPIVRNGPASERAIAAAEKTMKLAFPPELRASMLLHDGQPAGAGAFPWMPGCAPLLPVAAIVEEWAALQKKIKEPKKPPPVEPTAKLQPGFVRAGRMPIADGTFIDHDPGPAGTPGQLVAAVSKTDLVVIDTSFIAAFERWVSALERGIWVYSAALRVVHPKLLEPGRGHPAGLFSKR